MIVIQHTNNYPQWVAHFELDKTGGPSSNSLLAAVVHY